MCCTSLEDSITGLFQTPSRRNPKWNLFVRLFVAAEWGQKIRRCYCEYAESEAHRTNTSGYSLTPLRWKTWSSIQHGEWALRKVCESSPGGEESKTVRDTLYTGGRSRKEGTPRSCMSCMMLNTRWKSVLGLKQMLGGEKPSEGKSERPLRATACTHYANIYPPTWVPAPSYP